MNAINKQELLAELVGENIDAQFNEPEIGGPTEDPLMEGVRVPFS